MSFSILSLGLQLLLVSQAPQFDVAPSESQVEKEVVYEKETQVELTETQVKGELKLPKGFSTLSADAEAPASFLKDRLKFKLHESSRLAN